MNKRKKSKFGTIVFFAALAYLIYLLVNQQGVLYAKQAQIDGIDSKIQAEEENNARLKKQSEEINSNESVEKIARDMLGMVKHGERVFVDNNK
ncbi:FtsB family cell division protein [Acetivibrio cellulolyticus]|uniref:FtsB family cell division protein n=1 Tax=Acetivibrio cellulolyticus TaxID=35830 RepID=UPI0001E2D0D8|nr:septum formation initiator family protein [Acetivibrio cellulolyticus]